MATRSPKYPNISLGEAITKAKSIYEKEHMSALSPAVAAEAMGFKGINGSSLKTISSLRKYGLLEGRGEDVRLSKDAQTLIIDDPSTADYKAAVRRCALNPEIFGDLRRQFPGQASDRNVAVFLEKQGFKPDAAALTAKNFKDSMALVSAESEGYNPGEEVEMPSSGDGMQSQATPGPRPSPRSGYIDSGPQPGAPLRVVMNGNRLDIQASVDLAGLKKLKEMLTKYEGILEMMEPESLPWNTNKDQSAQVPFMITQAQRDSLQKLGHTEVAISNMTPDEAHRRLGLIK